jgi:hypothetical protein
MIARSEAEASVSRALSSRRGRTSIVTSHWVRAANVARAVSLPGGGGTVNGAENRRPGTPSWAARRRGANQEEQ